MISVFQFGVKLSWREYNDNVGAFYESMDVSAYPYLMQSLDPCQYAFKFFDKHKEMSSLRDFMRKNPNHPKTQYFKRKELTQLDNGNPVGFVYFQNCPWEHAIYESRKNTEWQKHWSYFKIKSVC